MNFKAYKLQYTTEHKETLKNNKRLIEIKKQIIEIKKEVEKMQLDKTGRSVLEPNSKSYFINDLNDLVDRLKDKNNIIGDCPDCEEKKVIIYNFEEKALCGACISKMLKERSSIVGEEKSEHTSENQN